MRYRWMRDPVNQDGPRMLATLSPEELDDAIDARMSLEPPCNTHSMSRAGGTMAKTQGAVDGDFVAVNAKHQTELTAITRPDGSFTICSDSFWHGEHEQGIAFDMTRDQAIGLANWLGERLVEQER